MPDGRYRIDDPARAPFVPARIKPLGVNGRPRCDFEIEPRLAAMAQDGLDIQVLIPEVLSTATAIDHILMLAMSSLA